MRVLLVHPGPSFSVADVLAGWEKGLRLAGAQVATFNLNDRLNFFCAAHVLDDDQTFRKPFDDDAAWRLALDGIFGELYKGWPDVVLVVSGFFFPADVVPLLRARGQRVVWLFTESPYEDDKQLERVGDADLVLLNDPTNLDRFRALNPNTHYQWHCYDPDRHCPGPAKPECRSDFAFVGTGYDSRVRFLESVDWSGIDVALAGHWASLDEESPLRKFVAHDLTVCCDNEEAVDLYRATKVSANLYRREANKPELSAGWAMGPREVELAACGTFFLRDPRGESDEVLSMLPTFDSPGDFAEKLRWFLALDEVRDYATQRARAAIAERTFENSARRLLALLSSV